MFCCRADGGGRMREGCERCEGGRRESRYVTLDSFLQEAGSTGGKAEGGVRGAHSLLVDVICALAGIKGVIDARELTVRELGEEEDDRSYCGVAGGR